jgi:hypothetical protein
MLGSVALAAACSTLAQRDAGAGDEEGGARDTSARIVERDPTCCLPWGAETCGATRVDGVCLVCCRGDACGYPPSADGTCAGPGTGPPGPPPDPPSTCARAIDDCFCQAMPGLHAFECAPGQRPPSSCQALRSENGVARYCCSSDEHPDAGASDAGAPDPVCSPACPGAMFCDWGTCRPACVTVNDCTPNQKCYADVVCALPAGRAPTPEGQECPRCVGYCYGP